jgi:hypothetical protein
MSDEKDRLGDKFRDVEAARESEWARKHDQELLEKLRARVKVTLKCPVCQRPLAERVVGGIAMLACPKGDGAWLDSHALESLVKSRK